MRHAHKLHRKSKKPGYTVEEGITHPNLPYPVGGIVQWDSTGHGTLKWVQWNGTPEEATTLAKMLDLLWQR